VRAVSGRRVDALLASGLAAAVVLLFLPVRHHELTHYDDLVYTVQNPHLGLGLSLEGLRWAFTTTHAANWIPLTWVSFLIDAELFGLAPAAILLTNVLLHAANAVLLFVWLRGATGARWRSAAVAALFAVHPLRVESVAWAAERKDVLAGLFSILTLIAWTRYAARPSALRYGAAALALAGALLAKPMAVTLPALLLLVDCWPLARLGANGNALDPARVRRALLEKVPLFALCAGAAWATLAAQRGALSALEMLPFGLRVQNAVDSYLGYLARLAWPRGLSIVYPYPLGGLPVGRTLAQAAVLVAFTAFAVRAASRRPWLAVGWLWYLGSLVPVIGLVQVGQQALADRYTYLPSVGIGCVLAFGLGEVVAHLRRPAARGLVAAATCAALAALGVGARRQLDHWRDGIALFERAVAVNQRNHLAHALLADGLRLRGELERAERHYRRALAIRRWAAPHAGLGEVLERRGDPAGAERHYLWALELGSTDPLVHAHLGEVRIAQGRLAAAAPELERALALGVPSGELEIRARLAELWSRLGEPDRAIAEYREILRLRSDLAAAANNLAWLLATHPDPGRRDPRAALGLVRQALAAGESPALLDTLAAALAAAGRFEEAGEAIARALAGAEREGDAALAALVREHGERIARGEVPADAYSGPAAAGGRSGAPPSPSR
jgi:tetratricopeptide (TPR) repeat protein